MNRGPGRSDIVVTGLSASSTRGLLRFGWLRLPCAVGRAGRRAIKREGDGATPIGRCALRSLFYRADRVRRPRTGLVPVRSIARDDGWCDAPGDANYNRRVRLPYAASTEPLWRDDHLYDVVIMLGFNDGPRARGRGSAIFVHLAAAGYAPTEGCVALKRADMARLLALLPGRVAIRVSA